MVALNFTGADSASLADAVSQAGTDARTGADVASVGDGVTRAANSPRTASDALAGTDGLLVAVGRSTGDSAPVADAPVDIVAQRVRTPGDLVRVTDSVVRQLVHGEIQDYQFVLPDVEPYVPFGMGETIAVEKFDPGTTDIRPQDIVSPVGDYRSFGTDLRTPPTWTFDLYTDVYSPEEAFGWMENFAEVWDAEETRSRPNDVLALKYRRGGQTRRVYGRTRNYAPIPGDLIQNGKGLITATFALAENVFYSDEEFSTGPVRILPESRGSGWVFPMKFPVKTQPPTNLPQIAQAVIQGRKRTWLDLDIHGPVVDPWIRIGELTWALRGTIAHDETVTVTGKPWAQGVRTSDGTYRSGMLDPRSRLSQLRLPPGVYPVAFGGFDPTKTSWASVRWRDAFGSM